MTLRRCLPLLALLVGAPVGAVPPPVETLDINEVKPKLMVLGDGKKHFIVINPTELMDEFFFYGDGKTMWSQRSTGGGREGDVAFDRVFWEPRVNARYKASFGLRDKKYTLLCDDRKTEFKPLEPAESKAILDGAKFMKPRWKHHAYALARDNTGRYFFVDQAREPEGNKNFRLWAGPKGGLKPQKMINVVSDSEGDIFATKLGELRLVLNKQESLWVEHKVEKKLIILPVEDNAILIYTDLGVYAGENLGTPCDDL
jgi:hypothetical protein